MNKAKTKSSIWIMGVWYYTKARRELRKNWIRFTINVKTIFECMNSAPIFAEVREIPLDYRRRLKVLSDKSQSLRSILF